MILSSGANHDPKIFKEPHVFKPGRENAERLLSWNNVAWHSHSSFSLVSLTAKGLFGSVGSWAVVFQWFSRGGEAKEWRDFKSCPSVAGCAAAPRGCPGTFLSMHIAKETAGPAQISMGSMTSGAVLLGQAGAGRAPKKCARSYLEVLRFS